MVVAFLVMGFYSFTTYRAATEEAPLTYGNIPFPTDKEQYHHGEGVVLTVTRCSTANETITYTFTRTIVDVETGDNYILPSNENVNLPTGCATVQSPPHIIPDSLPAGRFELEFVTKIKGRVREFEVHSHSREFNVVSRDGTRDSTRGGESNE